MLKVVCYLGEKSEAKSNTLSRLVVHLKVLGICCLCACAQTHIKTSFLCVEFSRRYKISEYLREPSARKLVQCPLKPLPVSFLKKGVHHCRTLDDGGCT